MEKETTIKRCEEFIFRKIAKLNEETVAAILNTRPYLPKDMEADLYVYEFNILLSSSHYLIFLHSKNANDGYLLNYYGNLRLSLSCSNREEVRCFAECFGVKVLNDSIPRVEGWR